ncbi:thioredoxin fold domain-containing protein [Emticicia sp. CRIBPO]|uniref:protein-disulfide reductase DsbD family protein n=1 Tax=Emticicia sp. CRIBPO TaxID=2683258 RepID=UPI001411E903|nr:cytochrome c biogenesis protein CcdA [Emticicia sp. CRIBPO]NBA88153.1 thioredoxin fold domain-containing protein [Emticicia sp. CRIBPO]
MFNKLSYIFVFLFSFLFFQTYAQIEKPATWSFKAANENPKVGETIELQFIATIDKKWYLYSSDFDPDLGPIVTTMTFTPNDSYQLLGKIKAVHPKKKFDEIWQGDVTYFKEKGLFTQKVKILKENAVISGNIEFQTCTEADGKCINGKEKFSFNIQAKAAEAGPVKTDEPVVSEDTSKAVTDGTAVAADTITAEKATDTQISTTESEKPVEETQSLWQFLLLAFGAGIASIFMPCIYPIMPMTVSFFTKQSNGRSKAVFYGLSIMAIFGVMGLITMAFGAPFLNFISTHWIPNLIFFLIFILFGISLLGAFEIVLPHEAVNKIDRMSDKGGLIGIFFMALTLVVVSFSCTVPFVGSLLILAAQGEVWRPLYGMLAFGLPFAIIFTALAMFPQFLKNLPKSGGWLNELKVVFGFLEFALALKFLSNIDLAYHWNLIHRNIFLVIWILIAFLVGLYILGFIRLSKDSKVEKYGWQRIFFSLIFFGLSFYMLTGVTGKPLALLSGILPPIPTTEVSAAADGPKNDKMRPIPHGLSGFSEFEDALAYSKEVGKPVLIDFTGYACANCRKMEENVWSKPEVLQRLKEDFVIASLYVDDKKELPKEKHYKSTYDDEMKTTIGDKNMDLEITKFNNNAQPYYVIVDSEGKTIVPPLGYSSTEDFIKFLDKGKGKK